MSLAAQIRAAMAGGEALNAMDLADRLGIREYAELPRIRHALADMEGRGVVIRVEQEPRFRLAEGRNRGEKQHRIWKAVVIRGAKGVTAREAAMLAAADTDYVKRYLRWLRREGYVLEISTGRHERGNVYRVGPGKEKLAAPQWNRRQADKRRRHEQEAEAGPGAQAAERGAAE